MIVVKSSCKKSGVLVQTLLSQAHCDTFLPASITSDESIGCLPQNCPNHTPETCGYKLAQNETDKKRARLSIQFESAESKDD